MFSRLFLAFSILVSTSCGYRFDDPHRDSDRILLSNVGSLLFRPNQMTTGRRSSPIQQMRCNGINCHKGPNSIMCRNNGMTDNDIVWECTGRGLVPGYVMKGVTVSCEGYNDAYDPYILRGSCGVVYRIEKDYSYQEPVTISTTTSTYYTDTGLYTNDAGFISLLFVPIILFILFGLIALYATIDNNTVFVDHVQVQHPPPRYVWYNPVSWTWTYPYPRRYHQSPYIHPTQVQTTHRTVDRSSTNNNDPTTSTTYANTVRR